MIAEYESRKSHPLFSPRIYGLNMDHKHLPEMQKICGLNNEPLFTPIVDDYYNGMLVSVQLEPEPQTVYDAMNKTYAGKPLIQVEMVKEPMLAANAQADTDELKIYVGGSKKKTIVTASFDNLGKGACGAAIQNMNLMLGLDEFEGLRKKEG